MPQAIGSEFMTLSNILFWVSIVLSIVVLAQVIHFVVLCVKMFKRQKKKDELREQRMREADDAKIGGKKGEKLHSLAGLILLFGFPTHLALVSILLILECGILTFANTYLTKELKKPLEEPEPEIVPEPEPEPAPVVIPVVVPVGPTEAEEELVAELMRESITIEEAHNAISDEVAIHFVDDERTAGDKKYAKKSIINIDTLSANFESGDTVNLETLKEKGLLQKKTDFVKVLARGLLDKHLTVEAQDFSADAVKMIILTGGKVVEVD